MGTETFDDACVFQVREDLVILQTVDYFTPLVDDPYAFGMIAAANSLSDIYAMGGAPLFALNIVGWPRNLPMEMLGEILRGGSDKAGEAGIGIIGGHSIDDPEPKYGLCVTGTADPDRIIRNSQAAPGDLLVLTKPLGTGIITTAIKNEKAPPMMIDQVIEAMSFLNRGGGEAMVEAGVRSATDVTGYGLLGHLYEMTRGSKAGARIRLSQVPVMDGVWDLARQGMVPGGTRRNKKYLEDHAAVQWGKEITEVQKVVLCDAQTSGGLLIAVSPEKKQGLLSLLREKGTLQQAVIGECTDDPSGKIVVN